MARSILAMLVLLVSAIGCARSDPSPSASVDPRYLMSSAPASSIGVLDLKEKGKSGEQVAVTGRIGGGVKPWIEGRAAFLLVDHTAPWPSAECGPDCPHCAQELAAASMVVKFVDDQGKTIAIDSRQLLGVKDEDEVVVNGVASRDEKGNVALMASSIFIKR